MSKHYCLLGFYHRWPQKRERVQYERSKATHAARCEPRAAPRQRVRHRFNGHWLTTGIATLTKGGLRLNLLSAPPPTPPVAPEARSTSE
eukprot:scaffold13199_cov59-Phaeocystis_antarctica.AAC.1